MFGFGKKEDRKPVSRPQGKPRRNGRIVAQYDLVNTHNEEGGSIRKYLPVEVGGEEQQQGGGLTLRTRFQCIATARHLMRNSSLLKTDVGMLQLSTIGTNCDLMFYNKPDDWFRKAEAVWRKWGKHASFKDNGPLVDLLDKILYSLICEGDLVVLFDGGEIENTGKILMFAADQIAPLNTADFDSNYGKNGWTQVDGIFRDKFGRVVGVCISPNPGTMSVSAEDALILLKDDPYTPCNWVFLKRSFRDSVRGVADALPILADLQDVTEILGYEKTSAKRFAAQYAYITEAPAQSAVTPEGFLDDEDDNIPGGEGNGNDGEKPEEYTVEHLQEVTGSMLDLLPNGSSIQWSPNDRPSPRTLEYVEAVREQAGGALGLTRSFSLAKADSSYTSARWDTGVSSKQFHKLAKYLDDVLLDWLADRVINWFIGRGELDEAPEEDWLDSVAFTHPSGREVLDEQKEVSANSAALKAGLTNLEALVGPNWRNVLKQLATEKAYAESLGLALSLNETASGQVVDTATTEEEETTTFEDSNND